MKSIKLLVFLMLAFYMSSMATSGLNGSIVRAVSDAQPFAGGGGDDKEKKEKKEKGDKKEKDESTKDAKTNSESTKPSKHARASAKAAMQSAKFAQQQILARAKVRNFFHNMFNTKYGKPVNFRNTRSRNRWSKGHKGLGLRLKL
jgi:hypothetical protein